MTSSRSLGVLLEDFFGCDEPFQENVDGTAQFTEEGAVAVNKLKDLVCELDILLGTDMEDSLDEHLHYLVDIPPVVV